MQAELKQIITGLEAIDPSLRYAAVTHISEDRSYIDEDGEPAFEYGKNILGRGVEDHEFLEAVLNLLPDDGQRLQAVKAPSNRSSITSLLYEAAEYPQSEAAILKVYAIGERLQAVTEDLGDGAVIHAFDESLNTVLALLHPDDRLPALKTLSKNGRTLLHWILWRRPEYANTALELYPQEYRLDIVKSRTTEGISVLSLAAEYLSETSKIEPFRTMLSLYPPDQRLSAVRMAGFRGTTILSVNEAITNDTDVDEKPAPRCLLYKVILELLPETDRLEFLNTDVHARSYCSEGSEADDGYFADDDDIDDDIDLEDENLVDDDDDASIIEELTVLQVMIQEKVRIDATDVGFKDSFVPSYLAIRSFPELQPKQANNNGSFFQPDPKVMRLKNALNFSDTFAEIRNDLDVFLAEHAGTPLAQRIKSQLSDFEVLSKLLAQMVIGNL